LTSIVYNSIRKIIHLIDPPLRTPIGLASNTLLLWVFFCLRALKYLFPEFHARISKFTGDAVKKGINIKDKAFPSTPVFMFAGLMPAKYYS